MFDIRKVKARDEKIYRVVEAYRPEDQETAEIIGRMMAELEYAKSLNQVKEDG